MAATLQQAMDELVSSKKRIAELEEKVSKLENRATKTETNIDSIGTTVDDVKAKANDAVSKANTASSDSKSALTKAGTAVNKANDAFGKASAASSAAEYAKSQAASAKSASDKTTSDLSTLRSTVTGQGTDITGLKKRFDDMASRVPTSMEYSDLKTVLGIFASSPINQTKVANAKSLVDPSNFGVLKGVMDSVKGAGTITALIKGSIIRQDIVNLGFNKDWVTGFINKDWVTGFITKPYLEGIGFNKGWVNGFTSDFVNKDFIKARGFAPLADIKAKLTNFVDGRTKINDAKIKANDVKYILFEKPYGPRTISPAPAPLGGGEATYDIPRSTGLIAWVKNIEITLASAVRNGDRDAAASMRETRRSIIEGWVTEQSDKLIGILIGADGKGGVLGGAGASLADFAALKGL